MQKGNTFASAGWWALATRGPGPSGSVLLAEKSPGRNCGKLSHTDSSSWSNQYRCSPESFQPVHLEPGGLTCLPTLPEEGDIGHGTGS